MFESMYWLRCVWVIVLLIVDGKHSTFAYSFFSSQHPMLLSRTLLSRQSTKIWETLRTELLKILLIAAHLKRTDVDLWVKVATLAVDQQNLRIAVQCLNKGLVSCVCCIYCRVLNFEYVHSFCIICSCYIGS